MPKKPVAAPTLEAKPVNPRKKGLQKVTVRLEPRQVDALQAAALRRAERRGSMQPDASEIVREALDKHPEVKGGKSKP